MRNIIWLLVLKNLVIGTVTHASESTPFLLDLIEYGKYKHGVVKIAEPEEEQNPFDKLDKRIAELGYFNWNSNKEGEFNKSKESLKSQDPDSHTTQEILSMILDFLEDEAYIVEEVDDNLADYTSIKRIQDQSLNRLKLVYHLAYGIGEGLNGSKVLIWHVEFVEKFLVFIPSNENKVVVNVFKSGENNSNLGKPLPKNFGFKYAQILPSQYAFQVHGSGLHTEEVFAALFQRNKLENQARNKFLMQRQMEREEAKRVREEREQESKKGKDEHTLLLAKKNAIHTEKLKPLLRSSTLPNFGKKKQSLPTDQRAFFSELQKKIASSSGRRNTAQTTDP